MVANKVKGVDGKWRTIDSKLLHRQGVAASEFYNQRVMDRVTDRLGLATELREVTPGKRPVVEIAGIDERLTAGFSTRSAGIKAAMVRLEADYRETHGRTPDAKARIALAQQATLETRPQKLHARALSELRTLWRAQAATLVGDRTVGGILRDAQAHARNAAAAKAPAETFTVAQAAAQVVETVSEHHAVWGPHTIEAETRRYLQADEAGMAGTTNLAKVTRIAQLHGAHVRLIGDDRQLSAVEAGGALRLLENEVGSVKLDQLHRFTNKDEAEATKLLRDPATTGDPFAWYVTNDRVTGGSVDRMSGDVFSSWQADTTAGLRSVMLAQQNTTVAELNARAQAFRMSQGIVTGKDSAPLRDGLAAYTGDTVVTRSNNSQLKVSAGRDIVKNGDLWTVEKAHRDGTLTVSNQSTGGTITLPKEYVATAVELGYASTIHRAQGMTADTAHVLADSSTSRELA